MQGQEYNLAQINFSIISKLLTSQLTYRRI